MPISLARNIYRRLKSRCRFVAINRLRAGNPHALASDHSRDSQIVVSLTSYGSRILNCDLAIRSLMNQTVMPDRIVLWIGEESAGIPLPSRLNLLERYGVEIRTGVRDLKGHKKYFQCMRENPDSIIITVDDDCVYSPDTVETLLNTHKRFPNAVVARRSHLIPISNGEVIPYRFWLQEWREPDPVPRGNLVATGVGGVLYPPGFATETLLDPDAIERYAINADDLWLKVYGLSRGYKVVWAQCAAPHPEQIASWREDGLSNDSNFGSNNDEALHMSMEHFGIHAVDFAL